MAVERKRILAIDGGGIRGVIPAAMLARLEEVTKAPARESFAFVAGTSTGAIIAAGLAAGIPAKAILKLYTERAHDLFPRRPWSWIARILTGSMYDNRALHRTIARELRTDAARWTLNDSPVDLLITSKKVSDGEPWYFVKDKPGKNAGTTGRLSLVDCVTASTAAPTYFQPWHIEGIGELVDGGTGVAGNPVYQACVEAFHYTGDYDPERTIVVSLGTGQFFGRERPRWIWPWLGWILSELFQSPGEQQTALVRRHFSEARFYRIDVELGRAFGLDSVADIAELAAEGKRRAETIQWREILAGSETPELITDKNTSSREYAH